MADQTHPLGRLLGTIGFFTGLLFGWSSTQNGWAALVCGVVVACIGAYVGNLLHRLLAITLSLVLALGSAWVRYEFFKILRESRPPGSTLRYTPPTSYETHAAQPSRARVIVAKANLRAGPSDGSDPDNRVVGTVTFGERLELLSADYVGRGWYHVRHPEPGEAWVHGNCIEFE